MGTSKCGERENWNAYNEPPRDDDEEEEEEEDGEKKKEGYGDW